MKKFVHKMWKMGIIAALLLTFVYLGTAAVLHELTARGVFTEKTYREGAYTLYVGPAAEDGTLEFTVGGRDSAYQPEGAKKGDHFSMDKEEIHYGDYVYTYDCLEYAAFDYEVVFPDGVLYQFCDGDDAYYGVMSKEESAQHYSGIADHLADEYGMDAGEVNSEIYEMVQPDVEVEAPDAKYSPELIRSALLTYKQYVKDDRNYNYTEGNIMETSGLIWVIGILLLCTRDLWIKLRLTILSWRLSYSTLNETPELKPSPWMTYSYITASILVLAAGYITMIYLYVHMH